MRVTRFRTHYEGRPGLVKMTFRNLNENVLVLRNKMKNSPDYRDVYVKSYNIMWKYLLRCIRDRCYVNYPRGITTRGA